MRLLRSFLFALCILAATSAQAFADVTVFLGSTATPSNRPAKGFAVGVGLLIVGFEFEFSDTPETIDEGNPSLRTGMGNMLLQTPFPIAGMQFYLASGGGLYRERLNARQETHFGLNGGGGVKINLIGPLRVRLDYRAFKLRGAPLYPTVHRVYAGLNLAL